MTYRVDIYTRSADLPPLSEGSYFHSASLMSLCEQTPRHKPYMAVATDADGKPAGHLLAIERYRRTWLPPFLYTHVRVMGEGIYAPEASRQEVFGQLVEALTRRLQHRALFIEFSHLSQKMFGYGALRAAGYFPVRWMNVHNSLHSRSPEERIQPRQLRRVEAAMERGVITSRVSSASDFDACMLLLRKHLWLKPRRYLPSEEFFRLMMETGYCQMFITRYHEKVVGCTVCVLSEGDAYLWFSASRRKSFASLHPNAVTFWNTIRETHRQGLQHIRFIDVGLPFRKSPYRDFILSFGGKEVSSYRWFRISIRWVNRLASWLWRE